MVEQVRQVQTINHLSERFRTNCSLGLDYKSKGFSKRKNWLDWRDKFSWY